MKPRFMLPTDYASRDMEFCLTRASNGKGWEFGAHHDGYFVTALNHRKERLCKGYKFATKAEAANMARILDFPPYAVWSGPKRCYLGTGAVFRVHARNHPENLGVS